MKKLLLFTSLLLLDGCTESGSEMARILRAEGITNIQITGYDWFACGKDDAFATGFQGNKNGFPVSGTVCSGWLKGHTIRYR